MNTKQITIAIPEEVAHVLEVRGAIDGLRLSEAISALLTKLARDFAQRSEQGKAAA